MATRLDPWLWVDGAFSRASQARIGMDRWDPWASFSLAESVPVEAGKPLWLPAHLDRLAEGSRAFAWPDPPRRMLARVLRGLVLRNRQVQGGLRLRWWGGLASPLLLVIPLPSSKRRGAVRLMTSAVRHYGPDSLQARTKAGQMLANRLAQAEIEAFAEDGLRLTPAGLVAEGVYSNVAMLRRGTVLTPPLSEGLLEGVTRARFLARARRAGLAVREASLTRYDLWTAERVWVLSSLRGVMEASSVDGRIPTALGPSREKRDTRWDVFERKARKP